MSCSLFIGEAAHLFKGLWKKGVLEQSVISISLSVTLSRFSPSSLWGDCVHSVWFDQLCLTGKGESEVERKMREERDRVGSWTLPVVQPSPAQLGIIQKRVRMRSALPLKGSH